MKRFFTFLLSFTAALNLSLVRMRIKQLHLLRILILMPVFAGCGNSQKSESQSLFAESDSIKWTIIDNNEIIPLANDFSVSDSMIYVLGLINDTWLHTYDISTGRLIANHIPQGQGPSDLINAKDMSMPTAKTIAIFDNNAQRLKLFDAGSYALDRSVDFTDEFHVIWDAFAINDGNYLVKAPAPTEDNTMVRSFSLVDARTMSVKCKYDQIPDEFKEEPMALIVQSNLAIAPDGKHFVSVTSLGGAIELFSIDNDVIKEEFSANPFPLLFTESNGSKQIDPNSVLGFISVAASDEFWVASYCGTNNEADANKIGIWDWKGNPIKNLTTDKMILKTALSPDSKKLYGILADKEGELYIGQIDLK